MKSESNWAIITISHCSSDSFLWKKVYALALVQVNWNIAPTNNILSCSCFCWLFSQYDVEFNSSLYAHCASISLKHSLILAFLF